MADHRIQSCPLAVAPRSSEATFEAIQNQRSMIKLNLLAFGAHPDDVEIGAGGTVIQSVKQGLKVGIIDLTRGELGSRGSAELRDQEAAASSIILGVAVRENIGLRDGFFQHNEESMMSIIKLIRKYQPETVLCPAPSDRHPDHGRASKLIRESCYYAGLQKIETRYDGQNQMSWRPAAVYSFVQDYYHQPDFVFDITDSWEQKIQALKCFGSQFYDPTSTELRTPISGSDYFDFLHARAMQMGRPSGFMLAEGFLSERAPGIQRLDALV